MRLAEATPSPDWVEVCQCLMFLDDAPRVADILARLIDGPEEDALVAYQVGGARSWAAGAASWLVGWRDSAPPYPPAPPRRRAVFVALPQTRASNTQHSPPTHLPTHPPGRL